MAGRQQLIPRLRAPVRRAAGCRDRNGRIADYLSVCAIYRDEAPYLREWIEFHRLVGVERFFLYDNKSSDNHRAALAPYTQTGIAIVHDWPDEPGMVSAFNDCLRRHAADSHWIAFLDVDEFLFSPTSPQVPELLREYEQMPGVGINRATFGTSGHRTRPPGLVLENYVRRGSDELRTNHGIKSVVNPRRAAECKSAHFFVYREGTAVNENKEPIPGGRTDYVSLNKLRINHYWIKSEAEFRHKKLTKPRAHTDAPRAALPTPEKLDRKFNALRDETILSYVPALKLALEAVEAEWGPVKESAVSA